MLVGLVDRVTRRLRGAGRVGRTVVLRLRFGDFSRASRSHTLAQPTDHTPALLTALRALLAAARPMTEERGITLLGIAITNLADADAVQLALPLERPRAGALDAAVDDVRDRFGSASVTRAVLLGRDLGPSVPVLPDGHEPGRGDPTT